MAERAFGTGRRRNTRPWVLCTLLLGTTALVATPKADAAGLIEDPSRPDLGFTYYGIPALTADGRIFAGNAYDEFIDIYVAHYGHPDGSTSAPGFGGGFTRIYGMSGDGNYVVGTSRNLAGYNRAFLWTAPDGLAIDLGLLYPGIANAQSQAWDVSGDGSTVVGAYSRAGITRAWAWIKDATTGVVDNEQMYELNSLDDANHWAALSISDDGRYAAGYSDGNATTSRAVRWDLSGLEAGGSGADVILDLGSLVGANVGHSTALDISADGRVVVGSAADDSGFNKAFRWVEGATTGVAGNEQMHSLGALGHDPQNQSVANAVSRDGQYVVGWSDANLTHRLAFRWTEARGMESMHDWLGRHGVSLGELALTDATAISDNGRVIAGTMTRGDGSDAAYIARVTSEEHGGGGLMDVEEYHRSLFSATSVASGGEFLTWLPMNGAHHRPLMQQGRLADGHCAWATGDAGLHGASGTALALAEMGGCVELAGGSVMVGLGVGTSHSWQSLALGGSSRLNGQYVIGEVDWQPDGTPLLLSLTGMLGGWQADIHRGYSNGATTAYSDGRTGIGAGVVRLRADWLEAATLGNTSINPWASVAVGQQHIGAYKESGGSFPAHFDAQTLGLFEMRVGVAAVSPLSSETTLTSTLELAHRSGTAPRAKGQVDGLFSFDLGGGAQSTTWLRAGLELDHRLADNIALSGSLHAATNGRDPSLSGALGIKMTF
jgi:probable HAF family extracellular repeat protein